MTATAVRIVGPRDGKLGQLGGIGVRFMVDGAASGGGFALVEHPMEPRALAGAALARRYPVIHGGTFMQLPPTLTVLGWLDQSFGQGLDDTLGGSIKLGSNAPGGDSHRTTSATFSSRGKPGMARGTPPLVISPARQGFKRPGLEPGWSVVCHQLSDPA